MTIKIDMIRLQLIREPNEKYGVVKFTSPAEVQKLVYDLIGHEDREHFLLLMLNTKNQINAIHTASIGTLNASMVHPREVFKTILINNSASVIFAHNHPSGDPTPSPEDIGLTKRLMECGKLLGIEVLDHVITGNYDQFFSLKERGYME